MKIKIARFLDQKWTKNQGTIMSCHIGKLRYDANNDSFFILGFFFDVFFFIFQRPAPLPICVECLGTEKCNPVGKEEALISCYGK